MTLTNQRRPSDGRFYNFSPKFSFQDARETGDTATDFGSEGGVDALAGGGQ